MLICPKTKAHITINETKGVAFADQTDVSYPIRDGIIDFIPEKTDRVSKAYDSSAGFYDQYMTSSGLLWKCYSLLFFGFMDETPLLQKPLSAIPDDFNGVLLDVPVGTGYFTTATYKNLSQATILAVDHSMSMLRQAQNHYAENGIRNVILIRADVANLPIQSQCVDRCLSMAGLHAFPDKDRALQEMARVLKPKGGFSGTCFIKGKWIPTDLLVSLVFRRIGYFSPPFYTDKECRTKFETYFDKLETGNVRSGFHFEAERNFCKVV